MLVKIVGYLPQVVKALVAVAAAGSAAYAGAVDGGVSADEWVVVAVSAVAAGVAVWLAPNKPAVA
jgi:hypothetical protein